MLMGTQQRSFQHAAATDQLSYPTKPLRKVDLQSLAMVPLEAVLPFTMDILLRPSSHLIGAPPLARPVQLSA
jgi:hypothetical protein